METHALVANKAPSEDVRLMLSHLASNPIPELFGGTCTETSEWAHNLSKPSHEKLRTQRSVCTKEPPWLYGKQEDRLGSTSAEWRAMCTTPLML